MKVKNESYRVKARLIQHEPDLEIVFMEALGYLSQRWKECFNKTEVSFWTKLGLFSNSPYQTLSLLLILLWLNIKYQDIRASRTNSCHSS